MKRNSELVKCLCEFRIDLLRTVFRLLRSRIIDDVLEIDFRYVKMRPLRERHLLPAAECLQTELQHPLRLILLGRNQAYDVFIKTFRYELLLDFGHEAVFIFLIGKAFQYFFIFTHISFP